MMGSDETYRLSNAAASEHDENHRPKQLGYKLSPHHHRFHLPPLKILGSLPNKLSLDYSTTSLENKLLSEFIFANKVDSHCPQLCRPADLISSETDNQVLTVNMQRANYNYMGAILAKLGNIAVLCGRVTLGPDSGHQINVHL